ncbi:arginine deiminase [Bacillus marinisedimentorum]|uniref:arginine deiminase n=1 Tax=Bacillus marinisedimentorum TaxID=1821260 RepID=UPI000872CD4D|nr:arginine deiminase [Bacillus marinisedimentorum]
MTNGPLHITSEIGRLEKVVLQRPGAELENLTPEYLHKLLFDDIPNLPAVQREHVEFAKALENYGAEVLYLEDLAAEALQDDKVRTQFVDEFLQLPMRTNVNEESVFASLKDYLLKQSPFEMVRRMMNGVRIDEVEVRKNHKLHSLMEDHYPFYLDPLTNLYFTRDPAAVIGNGISINHMTQEARRNEPLFMKYVMRHHLDFAAHDIPFLYDVDEPFFMEGGDQLVLSDEVLAIGISARTSAHAVEMLAGKLFDKTYDFKKVMAVEITKKRAFMHLDTVFTQIDHNKFTIHPEIEGEGGEMRIFILEQDEIGEIKIERRSNLLETLKDLLGIDDIELIPCGGNDPIASAREQWNDGSNTLAVSPGVVVTYDRNYVTNKVLREHGVEVIEVPSSELSRGRGGPRCMSMPIVRKVPGTG